jgi:hypothetical protein
MQRTSDLLKLRSHLPASAYPVVENWLRRNPVAVRVSRTRATKLGD